MEVKRQYDTGLAFNPFMSEIIMVQPNDFQNCINEPYHIYFICKADKLFFENDFEVSNKKISCTVSNDKLRKRIIMPFPESNNDIISGITYSFNKSRGNVTISYYRNFCEQEDFTLSGRDLYNNYPDIPLELEVVYIGQSYGKNGEKNAVERLQSHSTLQKIQSDIIVSGEDKELIILMMKFELNIQLTFPNSLHTSSKENVNLMERYDASMSKYNGELVTDVTEAALINYFKPEYNEKFTTKFPSKLHKTYHELFEKKFDDLVIEIVPDSFSRDKKVPYPLLLLKSKKAELLTSVEKGQIRYEFVDEGLVSTFHELYK